MSTLPQQSAGGVPAPSSIVVAAVEGMASFAEMFISYVIWGAIMLAIPLSPFLLLLLTLVPGMILFALLIVEARVALPLLALLTIAVVAHEMESRSTVAGRATLRRR